MHASFSYVRNSRSVNRGGGAGLLCRLLLFFFFFLSYLINPLAVRTDPTESQSIRKLFGADYKLSSRGLPTAVFKIPLLWLNELGSIEKLWGGGKPQEKKKEQKGKRSLWMYY